MVWKKADISTLVLLIDLANNDISLSDIKGLIKEIVFSENFKLSCLLNETLHCVTIEVYNVL